MRPRGGAGAALWCPGGPGVFQSDGCPLQTQPQCRGPKETPHAGPKSGGFGEPKTWGRAVVDCRGFAHLLSASLDAQPRVGQGLQAGARGCPWDVCSHARGWGSPQHLLATNGIAPWAGCSCCGWGKEKQQGGYFLSHPRGLERGWTWTAGSDSTANPHSLVPRGFLTAQHHPQHSVTLTVSHSTSSPSAVSPFRRIKQLIS